MQIIRRIRDLRTALSGEQEINLVPTMGNLHEGHLSLIRLAQKRRGVAVASIFVNPLQFAPQEDFAAYPRTLEQDCDQLTKAGCEVLFVPSIEEMYPQPQDLRVHPPSTLADVLEGEFRPGFFVGVATVVLKLFNIVRPAVAIFGKKDYQQWLVIKRLVAQLALPIEIVAGETVRDMHGLALSSRNQYLSSAERTEAAHLAKCLRDAVELVAAGNRNWTGIEAATCDTLARRGWAPDYISIRRQLDLSAPDAGQPLVILGAARLGKTRLIDNIEIQPRV